MWWSQTVIKAFRIVLKLLENIEELVLGKQQKAVKSMLLKLSI